MPVRFTKQYEIGSSLGDCVYYGNDYQDDNKSRKANFKCFCGNYFVASVSKVKDRHTRSCGCSHSDGLINRNTTHGKAHLPEYSIWLHIKQRCYNKNSKGYSNWGGRGITMCDEWRYSFEAFYNDMGNRPIWCRGIDRINNNKGYYKENCRWATYEEQCNNTRKNILIEYNGVTKTLALWVKELGLNYHVALYHFKNNKSIYDVFKIAKK